MTGEPPDPRGAPTRLRWITLAAWFGLCASLPTGVWDVLTQGTDQSWAVVTMAVLAQVAAGAGLGWPALVLALAMTIAMATVEVEYLFMAPVLLLAAAAGWAARAVLRRHGAQALEPLTAVVLIAAALPLAWSSSATWSQSRAPRLSPAEQRAVDLSDHIASDACPGSEYTSRSTRANIRRALTALARARRQHPEHVIRESYTDSHTGDDESVELRVRERFDLELADLDENPTCRALAARLRLIAGK